MRGRNKPWELGYLYKSRLRGGGRRGRFFLLVLADWLFYTPQTHQPAQRSFPIDHPADTIAAGGARHRRR